MAFSYKLEMDVLAPVKGWQSLAQQPRWLPAYLWLLDVCAFAAASLSHYLKPLHDASSEPSKGRTMPSDVHTCQRRALHVMAARQVRPRRAPQLQENSAEPPVFIPLDTAAKTKEQPSHPQPQEAARSQKPSGKKPVGQDAQARFRSQRKEVHEGRRAFQEQREALGLSTSSGRDTDRHAQAPATEAAAKELRQSLRDVYFDLAKEGAEFSGSGSDKAQKAKRQSQQASTRKSVGQNESPREGSADMRGRSASTSATSFQSQGFRDEEQPANSNRRVGGALGGARTARGAESSLTRGHKATQQGGAIGMHSQLDKYSSRRERRGNQDDTRHKGSSQRSRHSAEAGPAVAVETRGQAPVRASEADMSTPIVRRGTGSTATFFTKDTLRDIGASEEIVQALLGIGIGRPSHIQAAAYRALSADSSYVVLADHAGSGKTLAYLLPLVQRMREEEKSVCDSLTMRNCPRVIVLAPTTELCAQVLTVARSLAKGAPFRCIALTGGFPWRTQKEAMDEGVDLVIATPGRLGEHIKAGTLKLHQCQAIVMDEADVLLGDAYAFSAQIAPLRAACPPTTRFVMVTATLAASVFAQLMQEFPGILPAFGPGLHRTAPGVTEQLVDCSGGDVKDEETGFARKADALTRVMANESALRTIVFCNKIETCRKVENVLKRVNHQGKQGILVLPYHAAIEEGQRVKNLKTFLAPPMQPVPMALVCTDRASRGIDSAHVEHVVLFDFPRDPSEYVRRAGRVSRGAGGTGLVSILVLGRQVQVAKQLLERNKKGLPVHSIPVAIA